MTHRKAFLTPRGRLALAQCVVEHGWTFRRAADRFNCSAAMAKKWADRYRAGGEAAMTDVSSRIAKPSLTTRRGSTTRTSWRHGRARPSCPVGAGPYRRCVAAMGFARGNSFSPSFADTRSDSEAVVACYAPED